MIPLRFYKLQGAGNDFVLLDIRAQPLPEDAAASLARRLCDRRFGVGADGLLLVEPSMHADYRMRLYNADGSEATMCGNGIRCFARYLWEYHCPDATHLAIETGAGVRQVHRISPDRFRVAMGQPRVMETPSRAELFPPSAGDVPQGIRAIAAIHTGAPHLVLFVESVDAFPLETVGARLEHHPRFPDRVNVSVAQVVSPDTVRARVWERGAGATLACGTGACAIGVAGALAGTLARAVQVQMPGGTLEVEWHTDDALWLTGDAVLVFEGEWRLAL
ncbi:MAG: diaminopimelate epimerase [Fimbriimonadales bacterium]